MADSDSLSQFRRIPPPGLPGREQEYLEAQFQKLEQTINRLVEVIKKLEARIVVLETPPEA